jgi:hypothetical protein
MLNGFSRTELTELIERPAGTCISIFFPTEHVGPTVQQNAIRLENLLRRAEKQLEARGMTSDATQAFLAPALRLVSDRAFWEQNSEGLALFIAPELFHVYRLPQRVEELVVVGTQFHVLPLIALLMDDMTFNILTLGLDRIRLLRGTHYSVEEVELHGIPVGLKDALKYDEFARQPQFHGGIPGRGGERGVIFHGQGSRDDDNVAKDEILRYFQQADRGVCAALGNVTQPLVIAGISYLLPLYREASAYPGIIHDSIASNPDMLQLSELHAQAWAVIEPYVQHAQNAAYERYQQVKATQPTLATNYLRTIVPAAYTGRVATLFVADGQHQWGSFDPETSVLSVHDEARPGDGDLFNSAAIETVRHGGIVYVVAQEHMPDNGPLAALLRY